MTTDKHIDLDIVIDWHKTYNDALTVFNRVIYADKISFYDDRIDKILYYYKVVTIDEIGYTKTYLKYYGERWYIK